MTKAKYAFIPLEVIQDNRLTKRQLKVLIALFSFKNKINIVWPSREKLSKRCGMPITRVSEVTGQLVDLGWVIKTGKGGFSRPTHYEITVPKLVTVTKTVTVTGLGSNGYQNGNGLDSYQNGNGQRTNQELTKELKGGNKRFKPPTVDDVRAYCIERSNPIDAETFVSFYQSKNWYVGKNKMKCWKSSMITWEKREAKKEAKKNKASHVKAATLAMQGFDIDTGRAFDDGFQQIEEFLKNG